MEQIVSFEVAKLAKEKGFKPTNGFDSLGYNGSGEHTTFRGNAPYPSCTQSLLQKWLREIHKINVESNYLPNIQKYSCLYILMKGKASIENLENVSKKRFDTYEEALEHGLLKALELI